jgi:hypothetical protein
MGAAIARQEKAQWDAGYVSGFAYAVANLYRMHGCSVYVADMIRESGIKPSEMRKHVDEYDLNTIREIYRAERSRLGRFQ